MNTQYDFSKKPELYTYNELSLVLVAIKSNEIKDKITRLLVSIEQDKQKSGIFFMPEATYNIMKIFNNQLSICDFEESNIKLLKSEFELSKEIQDENIKKHIMDKINILYDFVLAGNKVYPTISSRN